MSCSHAGSTTVCALLCSVMDDDGASMVSQYTIATVSHAGTRRGGRFAPAAMHAAVPEREVAKHRTNRRHGLRTVLCLALTAAAAYALRVRRAVRHAHAMLRWLAMTTAPGN